MTRQNVIVNAHCVSSIISVRTRTYIRRDVTINIQDFWKFIQSFDKIFPQCKKILNF